MARAEITPTFFNAITGLVLPDTTTYRVNLRDTSTAALLFTTENGTTPQDNPGTLTTGRISVGWVSEGSYDVVISGLGFTTFTLPFEAVSGAATVHDREINVLDFAAVGDGVTDDSAAFQAAIDALPGVGGTILVPESTYLIASTLVMDSLTSVALIGNGAPRSGARLLFTVTGANSGISARSAQSCRFAGLTLSHASVAWTGRLLDLRRVPPGGGTHDTSMNVVDGCHFDAPQNADSAAIGIGLANSYGTIIGGNSWFTGGAVGVDGVASTSDFVNITVIQNCNFQYQNVQPIRNLSNALSKANSIVGCTFEPLLNDHAGAYLQSDVIPGGVLTFSKNWFGDSNASGTWITVNGPRGINIIANYFTKGASAIATNGDAVLNVQGNHFFNMTNAVDGTDGTVRLTYLANSVESVSTPIVETTFADDSFIQVTSGNGEVRLYGESLTADKGGTTHIRIGNPNGSRPVVFFGSAEDTALQKEDFAGIFTNQTLAGLGGVATRQKAGSVSDADFTFTPRDATMVVDSTNNKLWVRVAGTWKATTLTP